MLNIRCTKKLLDELKLKPGEVSEEKPLFSWHANLLHLHRRKAVLLVNDLSRYPILIYGLKAPDLKRLDKMIADAVKTVFLAEGVLPDIVEKYFKEAETITFTRTSDRSVISAMNQIAEIVSDYDPEELDQENLIQTDFSLRMGDWITTIDEEYKHPREVLLSAMSQLAQGNVSTNAKPVVSVQAYQLLMTLALDNHKVWRRVMVPADINFRKLHYVIQDAFGWQSYHLYEFVILNENKPVAQIVCDEESLEYADCPAGMDNKIKLAKYLPEYKQIGYIYDMGDDWTHVLELEKELNDYDKNYPICIDGEGNCPPEDVGGEGGYEEFLEAIEDPEHPEHEDMLEWGEEQGYYDFSVEEANRRLKSSLKRRR